MVMTVLPWLAAGMGVLVSPDHLKMWGHLAGSAGPAFWAVVLTAAAVYAPASVGYRTLADAASDGAGYLGGLHRLGGTAAVALALASRLTLATGLSTGVLVTAGFVFTRPSSTGFPISASPSSVWPA